MPETIDFEQALVCWTCGTPVVMHADGAEKPCGHGGTVLVTRATYRRQKGQQVPETIDFKKLARCLIVEVDADYRDGGPVDADDEMIAAVSEQLRQVWNARGDADRDLLQLAAGALADIAHSDDMTLTLARQKASRVYRALNAKPDLDR